MKKNIPFTLFGENQYIMFDILRLAELERALGMPINQVVQRQDAGVNFCLTALPIGMKQHYRPDPKIYADKIEQYLEQGGAIDEIAIPIVKAIIASGIFGKTAQEEAEKFEVGEEEKNLKEGTE